jgi:hypothetical protein
MGLFNLVGLGFVLVSLGFILVGLGFGGAIIGYIFDLPELLVITVVCSGIIFACLRAGEIELLIRYVVSVDLLILNLAMWITHYFVTSETRISRFF